MKNWQVTGEEDEDVHFICRYCDGTAQPVVEEYRCWFPNFTNKHPIFSSIQQWLQHTGSFIRTTKEHGKNVCNQEQILQKTQ
jgi:hypothetical protein